MSTYENDRLLDLASESVDLANDIIDNMDGFMGAKILQEHVKDVVADSTGDLDNLWRSSLPLLQTQLRIAEKVLGEMSQDQMQAEDLGV
jgi:hypothetical protein